MLQSRSPVVAHEYTVDQLADIEQRENMHDPDNSNTLLLTKSSESMDGCLEDKPEQHSHHSSTTVDSLCLSDDQDYKRKYRQLKRQFLQTVQDHEYIKSELRHDQQKLRVLTEDKYFLLERMLQYEKVAPNSPEFNVTAAAGGSDSDSELATGGDGGASASKKVKRNSGGGGGGSGASGAGGGSRGGVTIASAFSKLKSFSLSRKSKKSVKMKCPEDIVESPSDSVGTFDDENVIGSSEFRFPTPEDSD